ncbi:AraC family transcriptional regulator [Paenibacillus hexagrammi]|uniref:AraC family transcriptional regulator n=1 Tax=Paenibacillus hexagrammi TaxID=2908839 RepID=A0ABY3SJP4_9BACL|nr:AraC family transcriptional regulator [Paenibacillus sp. YPD9-1]UJF34038.1 AraC family transcriptional regulator [Paenibacillus sp. YPD9-1]
MGVIEDRAVARKDGAADESIELEAARLAHLANTYAPHDGVSQPGIPGLYISRYSQMNNTTIKTFYTPSLLLVAQGAKTITAGQETYRIAKSQILLLPVALPIATNSVHAAPGEPFLAIRLELDLNRIAELVLKVFPQGIPPVQKRRAGYVGDADLRMMNAAKRLLECITQPHDAELLAPLILDEILIRVLRSPIGIHVAETGFAESSVQRVVKAIVWLRENFSLQMKVAELAEQVHMSESSFHEHFKAVTSLSPLQYQKALRLHEARRLMVSGSMDASTACQLVGYVSASQFSRDYSRFFGNPPRRDIVQMRQQPQARN